MDTKPPTLLLVGEVAAMLRTTPKAVYALVERQQLPGVIRLGRRVLVCQATLVEWLAEKGAPSKETGQ